MIYVSCQFETPTSRSDHGDYIRALPLDISGCDANGDRINNTMAFLKVDDVDGDWKP